MNLARLEVAAIGLAVGGIAFWLWKKGGPNGVAAALSGYAVDAAASAASGAVVGTVSAVSQAVGLPTPAQTTTDAATARWLIDNVGYLEASKWSGAGALFSAFGMAQGSGTPPAVGSELDRQFPHASYDEGERLLKRYPAPAAVAPAPWVMPSLDLNDPNTWSLGL